MEAFLCLINKSKVEGIVGLGYPLATCKKTNRAENQKINSSIVYPKGDLNPHSCNSQRILSPSCLPFHHSGSLGAKNGTRTRDPNLGKVVLYQLSYFRSCECKDKMLFWFCKITARKIVNTFIYLLAFYR